MADTVAYVALGRAAADRRAGRPRPARRRPPARLPRRVGRARRRRPPQDRRHRRAAHAGAARCTASPSTSTPTSPCSATSCRAASPTRRSRRSRPRASTSRCSEVVDAVAARAALAWGGGVAERQDVAWRLRPDDLSAVQPGRGPGRDREAGGTGAPPRPPGRGRCHRGAGDLRAQARLAAGQGHASAPTYLASQADDARPRARHGVRGGRLPEHLRVLGRRHGHVHDQRRALHPGLRLLPGRHPPTRGARPRRARAGRRGRRAHGPRATPSSPPWPATTSPTAARPRSPRPSAPSAAARRAPPSRC